MNSRSWVRSRDASFLKSDDKDSRLSDHTSSRSKMGFALLGDPRRSCRIAGVSELSI
jgi:hypothetical protein